MLCVELKWLYFIDDCSLTFLMNESVVFKYLTSTSFQLCMFSLYCNKDLNIVHALIVLPMRLLLHTFVIDFLIISALRLTIPANALLQSHPFLPVTSHTFLATLCLNFPLWRRCLLPITYACSYHNPTTAI